MITFYHTGCPKCRILEAKMKAKNIEFTECSDVEKMQQKGIMSVPQLEVDGILMDFAAANKWINERN
jgi:glutaredoxin